MWELAQRLEQLLIRRATPVLYFHADPRDGNGNSGVACSTCCCQPLSLRPGETNRMVIDYSAWSLPIGWVVPTPQFSIEECGSTCDTSAVDGFGPPSNTNYTPTTANNTAVDVDLGANASPAGNTYTYRLVGLSGPLNGQVAQNGAVFTYTPNAQFQGYDYFDFEMEDAQGRKTKYTVRITVGTPQVGPDASRMASVPYIDRGAIKVDEKLQLVSFPITMPTTVDDCQSFRLTIKQPAKDCDCNIYQHFACFDVKVSNC